MSTQKEMTPPLEQILKRTAEMRAYGEELHRSPDAFLRKRGAKWVSMADALDTMAKALDEVSGADVDTRHGFVKRITRSALSESAKLLGEE